MTHRDRLSAAVTIASASSMEQARRILAGATPPNSSFTQLSNFSDQKIDRALRLGLRKPEWTWFAADQHGAVLGVVAGWGNATRRTAAILDFLDLPGDPAIAAALFERAVADSADPGRQSLEIIHFLPNESGDDDPQLVAFVASVAASGFRLLVRRHRYRMPVDRASITIPDTRLRFEPLAGEHDPRLPSIVAEILVGSLDAHDVAALAKVEHSRSELSQAEDSKAEDSQAEDSLAESEAASLIEQGLFAVARSLTEELLEGDPVDSFFLAIDPEGEVVGLVVGGLRGTPDVGVASFIGVSHRHRGHGYAGQLLGWITARMIAQNAETLIGETDDGNFPMDAAFRLVGYPHTESRMDFVRDFEDEPPRRE